jgi:predicted enzyme related to lactoylglutathione lyase
MIEAVATVWVPVEEMERAIGFYRDTLGLEVEKKDGDWAEVDANGVTIGLNEDEEQGAGVRGGPVIAFKAQADIQSALQQLRDRGVEIAAEVSEHPWGRVATFKDSEGNDLQLYEPPSG